jgi:hypothetical protein
MTDPERPTHFQPPDGRALKACLCCGRPDTVDVEATDHGDHITLAWPNGRGPVIVSPEFADRFVRLENELRQRTAGSLVVPPRKDQP